MLLTSARFTKESGGAPRSLPGTEVLRPSPHRNRRLCTEPDPGAGLPSTVLPRAGLAVLSHDCRTAWCVQGGEQPCPVNPRFLQTWWSAHTQTQPPHTLTTLARCFQETSTESPRIPVYPRTLPILLSAYPILRDIVNGIVKSQADTFD